MAKSISIDLNAGIGVIKVDDQRIHGVTKAAIVTKPGAPSIVKLTLLAKTISFRDLKVNVKEGLKK